MTTIPEPVADLEPHPAAVAPTALQAPPARWSLLTRIAFRFTAVYFSLYIVLTQMVGGLVGPVLSLLPTGSVTLPGSSWTVQTAVTWLATSVLGFSSPLVTRSGSGDKPFDLALIVLIGIVAAVGTVMWSLVARRRQAHPGAQKWFRLFFRFGLGTTMLGYGMVKFIPLQMPFPGLTRLLTPYGNFSLMGVLWSKIGSSPAYETFTGVMELTCAVLLFIPGLTTVGALLSFITSTQIFALNMMYDVPVKLFSLHLMILSLVLLAPDVRRLFRVMVLRRGVDDAPEPPLARRAGLRRGLAALQVIFGAWLIVSSYQSTTQSYATFGAGAPRPPLYGIWDIERMEIDGVERAPLVTDYDRWRRMVIQAPTMVAFQRMNDTFQSVNVRVDAEAKTMTFTRGGGPQAAEMGKFTFEQPTPDRLIAHGELDGRPMRLETRRFPHEQLQMFNNRFRWIQDFPFNR
jgi:hypothetical protein